MSPGHNGSPTRRTVLKSLGTLGAVAAGSARASTALAQEVDNEADPVWTIQDGAGFHFEFSDPFPDLPPYEYWNNHGEVTFVREVGFCNNRELALTDVNWTEKGEGDTEGHWEYYFDLNTTGFWVERHGNYDVLDGEWTADYDYLVWRPVFGGVDHWMDITTDYEWPDWGRNSQKPVTGKWPNVSLYTPTSWIPKESASTRLDGDDEMIDDLEEKYGEGNYDAGVSLSDKDLDSPYQHEHENITYEALSTLSSGAITAGSCYLAVQSGGVAAPACAMNGTRFALNVMDLADAATPDSVENANGDEVNDAAPYTEWRGLFKNSVPSLGAVHKCRFVVRAPPDQGFTVRIRDYAPGQTLPVSDDRLGDPIDSRVQEEVGDSLRSFVTSSNVAIFEVNIPPNPVSDPTRDEIDPYILPTPLNRFNGELPFDTNGDGKFEDLNGDWIDDETDADILSNHLDDPVVSNNPMAYDFDGDGDVDWGDVSELEEDEGYCRAPCGYL